MRKAKYDLIVLEELLKNDNSNSYRIAKFYNEQKKGDKPKKDKIQPSVISKVLRRLESKKLIAFTGVSPDHPHPKQYSITLFGLVDLYQKRQKTEHNMLEFHRSMQGQEIIDRIIKDHSNIWEGIQNIQFFTKVLYTAPSSINFFTEIAKGEKPNIIRELSTFKELVKKRKLIACGSPVFTVKEDQINYLNLDLPLKLLAQDHFLHPDDTDIKKLFIEALLNKNIDSNNFQMNMYKQMFRWIIKSMKNNVVQLDDTTEKSWEKFQDTLHHAIDIDSDCLNHWYVYLPPLGEPRFRCDSLNCIRSQNAATN